MAFVAFDLEGPLTPHDHAYELMGLFPGGDRIFEVISHYDDLLTLEGRPGYEPGDTLALIAPFLLLHSIGIETVTRLARENGFVRGAPKTIATLRQAGWEVALITTTYAQYAKTLAGRLHIRLGLVYATEFPLGDPNFAVPPLDLLPVTQMEARMRSLKTGRDDKQIKHLLDQFYWKDLPLSPLGPLMSVVKPVGGWRKVSALQWLAPVPLSQVAVVGDSITDGRMLETVDRAGGLAVAFNANQYALPYATCGLASTHISDILPLLEEWRQGGREAARQWAAQQQGTEHRKNYQWLARGGWEAALPLHREIRRLVRSRAAILG